MIHNLRKNNLTLVHIVMPPAKNTGAIYQLLEFHINAGLKMDRNGRFESGRTETSTHLSIIHPAKGRHGVLGRPHKKVSVLELH
jgi:hypothetical protein